MRYFVFYLLEKIITTYRNNIFVIVGRQLDGFNDCIIFKLYYVQIFYWNKAGLYVLLFSNKTLPLACSLTEEASLRQLRVS